MASAAPTKSDRTRASILASARLIFNQVGYDKAGVRTIAAHANIDPSMIIRYFGSKHGLFLAAVDVDLALPKLTDHPKQKHGRLMVEHFVSRWEGDLGDDVLVILLRSATTNEEAAARIRQVYERQIRGLLRSVVDRTEVNRRAALLASHMLGLALTRYVLQLPGIARQKPAHLIRDHAPVVQRFMHGALPK